MRIAITGGIGTGKSFVCKELSTYGIKIYDADSETKRLMRTCIPLQQALSQLIGQTAVIDGQIQKRQIAQFLLASDENKQALNDVVHPFVARDFMSSPYSWMETAILYESGFNNRVDFDFVVAVSAPDSVRIERVARRDNISIEKASQWVKAQMKQEEIDSRANFVIHNDGQSDLKSQIRELLQTLNILSQSNLSD